MDPLRILPLSVTLRIFGYVDLETLALCARGVSTHWMHVLYGSAVLFAVLLPYLPHNAVKSVIISAKTPDLRRRQDAADSCRLLSKFKQHRIERIVLDGHGIDTAIMEFLGVYYISCCPESDPVPDPVFDPVSHSSRFYVTFPARIISPHLTHIQFHHVGLSFERRQFLNVLQTATNVSSLTITRRPFRRATILSPLLSLFATTLTHLRLDNLAAEQIPNIGNNVPNLISLELNGLIDVDYWADQNQNTSHHQLDSDMIIHPDDSHPLNNNHNDPFSAPNTSRIQTPTTTAPPPIFSHLPRLQYLSCTNMDHTSPESVTTLMTLLLNSTPSLTHLLFSCPNYMMDLWPCIPFWTHIRHLTLGSCLVTSDFVRSLQAGVHQIRTHYAHTYGIYPDWIIQVQFLVTGPDVCIIEDAGLVRSVFGDACFVEGRSGGGAGAGEFEGGGGGERSLSTYSEGGESVGVSGAGTSGAGLSGVYGMIL
ncbi:hypothetical protein HDU98_008628 [Podochytrium sp. JEL0797]|nr:hypothetical protein HDU98_008628 [Podochytrium sp. JEL0797]